MNAELPKTIYLVSDLSGEYLDGDTGRPSTTVDEELGIPVRSFTRREDAEACCADFEREKRAEVNPFEYGATLDGLTHLDPDRFHDWILDTGLEPPGAENELRREDWMRWWDEQCPNMTELQQAKMWQALVKLRFYRVVELRAANEW